MNIDTSVPHNSIEFSHARLDEFLRAKISGLRGALQIARITGGQSNPTFFVDYENRSFVLRKQPPGELLPSAHAIDREYRVMSALAETDVPVPALILYHDGRDIIGTPFYVMERLEGQVFHDCALPIVPREKRRTLYRAMAATLAQLHNVKVDQVGLSNYGRSSGYFNRQIGRWTKQWELSQTRDDPNIERLIEWLPKHIPDNDTTAIAHGDYRVGNVMFQLNPCRVVAVLDWELSTLGHPLADLAHSCMTWHSLPSEYGGLRGLDLRELGIPHQAEYEEAYYEAAAHNLRMTSFHMAFALFRFAVIFEGIAARANSGNANDAQAAQTGRLAANFARRAVDVLDRS